MRGLVLFILAAMIIAGCSKEESNLVQPKTPVVSAVNYYPGQLGSSFDYKMEALDSLGTVTDSLALVTMSFDSTMQFNGVEYFVENVSLNSTNPPTGIKVLFRRSEAAVYFAIDTAGYNELLPDSLLQNITITSDPEVNVFSYPLFAGKQWTSYKLNVELGAFQLSLVDVQAIYAGKESISVPALAAGTEAERIDYNVTLTIPNPDSLMEYNEQKITLSAWYVKDVGLSLIEGDMAALNTIFGADVLPQQTTAKLRLSLLSYELK